MDDGMDFLGPPSTGAPPSYEEAMGPFLLNLRPPPFEMSRFTERLPGAVMTQPGGHDCDDDDVKWMALPRVDPGSSCPYGLEYLLELNVVHVKRERWRMFEGRRYAVNNGNGEKIYLASDGGLFNYSVQDQLERHVFTIKRESMCLCFGMSTECTVESPPGEVASYITGTTGYCLSNVSITDADRNQVFSIKAPLGCSCCEDENLPVLAKSVQVAQIKRRYPEVPLSERFDYIITFPRDLEVRMKAALISTAIKIDVEASEQRSRHTASNH